MFQAWICRKRLYVTYLRREKQESMNFKRIVHAAVAQWQAMAVKKEIRHETEDSQLLNKPVHRFVPE